MAAQITPLPIPVPNRNDPVNFAARADAFLTALPDFADEANILASEAEANALSADADAASALASKLAAAISAAQALQSELNAFASAQTAVNAPGTSATSTTSHTINLSGPKVFQIQTGKQFGVGQFVIIAYNIAPNNYIIAQVTATDPAQGTLTVQPLEINGSGTFTDWTISLTALAQTSVVNTEENLEFNLVLTRAAGSELLRDLGLNLRYNPLTNTLIVPNIDGAVTQAARLSTPRQITVAGDLSGSLNFGFDGTQDVILNVTIEPNSVALGADTVGNYVSAGAVSGNGLSGSLNAEGGTFTVACNATNVNNPNTIVYRDASGNFSASNITADLTGTALNALNALSATNVNGGTVNATTGAFSGKVALTTSDTLHQALGNAAGTVNLSFAASNYYSLTPIANITVAFLSPPPSARAAVMVVEITNGGSFVVNWPASVKWPLGTAPELTTTGVDVLVFLTDDGGVTYRGLRSMEDSR